MRKAFLSINIDHKYIGYYVLLNSKLNRKLEAKGYEVINYNNWYQHTPPKVAKNAKAWHFGKKVQSLSLCDVAIFWGNKEAIFKKIAKRCKIPFYTNVRDVPNAEDLKK